MLSSVSLAQSLSDLSFGTEETLDIVTWNIEWFPKEGTTTMDSVATIIQSLDAEVIALQEIDNIYLFNQMMDEVEGFSGLYIPEWNEGLMYIYNDSKVEIKDLYYIFENSWFEFPRAPLVLELKYNSVDYVLINNHLKCCGDGNLNLNNSDDEETRRYDAMNKLYEYVEYNFPDENVILLGDLNDRLDDPEDDNVFQTFIDDQENYLFTDIYIAQGSTSNWSYPSWPSHLDHIMISDELFDAFGQLNSIITTIKVDDYMDSFWEYENKVSDHRPVGISLVVDGIGTSNSIITNSGSLLNIYPNPCAENCQIEAKEKGSIKIFNSQGKLIDTQTIFKGFNNLDISSLFNGIYYLQLNNKRFEKLIIMK